MTLARPAMCCRERSSTSAFERVLIRTSLRHLGGHRRRELTVAVEHGLGAADVFGPHAAIAVAGEHEPRIGEVLVNALGCRAHAAARAVPRDLSIAHRRSEEVLRRHGASQRGAGDSSRFRSVPHQRENRDDDRPQRGRCRSRLARARSRSTDRDRCRACSTRPAASP